MGDPREYVCDDCGKRFQSCWSDEEADAECKELLVAPPEGEDQSMAVLCHPCWLAFMEWASREGLVKS